MQKLGNRVRASYSYDAADRVTTLANVRPDGTYVSRYDYAYDDTNNKTRVQEADGNRVTWTYDPLLVTNARLNLVRLGARAGVYLRNVYGELGGLYGRIPTDRFEVLWRLDSAGVARAARGAAAEPRSAASLPRAEPGRLPRARRVAVAIPGGAPGLYADDPAAGRRARLRLRRVAEALFGRGYEAVSVAPDSGGALYVFER